MNRLTAIEDLKGKTIKNAAWLYSDFHLGLLFTDGSFALFYADGDEYNEGSVDIAMLSNKHTAYDLQQIGAITQEEAEVLLNKEKAEQTKKELSRKRQMFESLKKELGEES
jgi:uncharacterized HAD superfamily protein